MRVPKTCYVEQAEQCRAQAKSFTGRAEARLLLKVAAVFDELAREGKARRSPAN